MIYFFHITEMHRFSHSLEKIENSVQRERDRETEKDLDT